MATPADQLYGTALTGLERLASTDPKAYEDALYERARLDLERRATLQDQATTAGMSERGLGLSTVLNDMRAKNTREYADALVRARLDAATAARQAQQSALGQAAATSQGEMQRRQQSDQFQAQMAQQRRALAQQGNVASNQMLAQGLRGLTSAGLYMAGRTPEGRALAGRGFNAIGRGIDRLRGRGGEAAESPALSPPGSPGADEAFSAYRAGDREPFAMPAGGGFEQFGTPDYMPSYSAEDWNIPDYSEYDAYDQGFGGLWSLDPQTLYYSDPWAKSWGDYL